MKRDISPHSSLAFHLFENAVFAKVSPIKVGPFLTPHLDSQVIFTALQKDTARQKNNIDNLFLDAIRQDLGL